MLKAQIINLLEQEGFQCQQHQVVVSARKSTEKAEFSFLLHSDNVAYFKYKLKSDEEFEIFSGIKIDSSAFLKDLLKRSLVFKLEGHL